MTSAAFFQPETAPVLACTVARDILDFGRLIEDMEREFGENWGDLGFDEAIEFIRSPGAGELEFLLLAVGPQDEGAYSVVSQLIVEAKSRNIHLLLVAGAISPVMLHRLLSLGLDDFLLCPLTDSALHEAVSGLRQSLHPGAGHSDALPRGAVPRSGQIIAVQAVAGGCGATTLACGLASALAQTGHPGRQVCLIDLDLQSGAAAARLGITPAPGIDSLLADLAHCEARQLHRHLQQIGEQLWLLPAPDRFASADLITPTGLTRLLDLVQARFDYVILDLPAAMTSWSQAALARAQSPLLVMAPDQRSARNLARLAPAIEAARTAGAPRLVLNRVPGRTDLVGKARLRQLCRAHGLDEALHLPDGGAYPLGAISQSQSEPRASLHGRDPLSRAIRHLAANLEQAVAPERAANTR